LSPVISIEEVQSSSEDRTVASARRGDRWGEIALVAYVTVAVAVTAAHHLYGVPDLAFFASSPNAVAQGRWWTLITSGLLITPPLMALQVVALLALGFVDIRLCGARVFWTAAALAHFLGTVLVYCGVWIIGAAGLANVAAAASEPDFGVSLVWFAGIGVLAAALASRAWSTTSRPVYRSLLFAASIAIPIGVVRFDGTAHYEHALALLLSAAVVLAPRRGHASVGWPFTTPWGTS
jgi:hypothetical protein